MPTHLLGCACLFSVVIYSSCGRPDITLQYREVDDYPVADWVTELLALPPGEQHPWMVRHPDGRRWIGIKAGTYLVVRAIQASGKSVVDLVSTPTDEIIEMAHVAQP